MTIFLKDYYNYEILQSHNHQQKMLCSNGKCGNNKNYEFQLRLCHHPAKTSLEVQLPSQCLSFTICQVRKNLPILPENCYREKKPGPNLFCHVCTELHSPGGSDTVCLQCRRPGLEPWAGEIPQTRAWRPTPVFLPAGSHGHFTLYYTVKTADFCVNTE